MYSLPGVAPVTTRVEIPNPQGGQPIVVSTNTAMDGGLTVFASLLLGTRISWPKIQTGQFQLTRLPS
jgi:hypothetical protein